MYRFMVKRCNIRRELMQHQEKYRLWASKTDHPACFMQMRLGKTLATIRWIQSLDDQPLYELTDTSVPLGIGCMPILVVAPVSVIQAWEKELVLEGEEYTVVHGKTFDQRTELAVSAFAKKGRHWVLINYDALRCTPGLTLLPWYTVILDESTTIKSIDSKISKLCTSPNSFKNVMHRQILSGLPSPEGELDLFQQFMFLHGNFMGYTSFWHFRNACFELKWDGWQPKKGVSSRIKDYVHSKAFVMTMQQAGIGSKKIRENRYVKMTQEQERIYNRIEDEFVSEVGDFDVETDHVITQRVWLARVAGGSNTDGDYTWLAKVNELLYLLKNDLANEPVVVCFRFTSEIMAVAQFLKRHGVLCQTLTGEDTREQRVQKQNWFRTSTIKPRVMLMQIKKVASHGVDMSVSSTMIFYSVTLSCEEMAQVEERILHPQKKDPLLYIYLVTEGTIDEDAVATVRSKVTDAKMFMKRFKAHFLARRELKKTRKR